MPRTMQRTIRQSGELDAPQIARLLNAEVAKLCPGAPANARIAVTIDVGSYEMRSSEAKECTFLYLAEWTETEVSK